MKLYMRYFLIHLKSVMQYKVSFFLTALGQFLTSFNIFLGIYFMFMRFHSVNGFKYSEVLLCFSIVLTSYSLAELFYRGFDLFPTIISNGEFDRVMVRPRSPILQVLGSKIEFTRIGRLLQSFVMFAYAIPASGIKYGFDKVFLLAFMILGGTVLFSGIFLIYAAICFYTTEGLECMNILTDGGREYGKYPLSIYGKSMLKFTTYIIPYACFQYYPFLYLIDRVTDRRYLLLPFGAVAFYIPCYLIWRFGVGHYKSTGS